MRTTATGDRSYELAKFGYKQELDRSIGKFASFAAGVSYISILTVTFQLFYFGFAFGGPAYGWTWPMAFVGQLMVALCFAEYYWFVQRHKIGALASHASQPPSPAVPETAAQPTPASGGSE